MTPSPAYTVTELLSHGRTVLYRAIRNADGRHVVLKVLDPQCSRPKDFERLKHEYEIEATLATPAAVKALAVDAYQGMPALVLEDFGGQPLDSLLGVPMATGRFLPLAVRIAWAVAEVHEHGVIHKDLKPQNILLDPTTDEVKIADFELASRLPREQQAAQPPRLIEGSLPYLAPEQTGRTNRAIDDRTDLYSLGVTFYQMLTARLPFEARDPAEWVHCHVARAPPSPAEAVPEVPEPIACIVLKLLSKMPEDRYQSARGLQLDWERCLAQWSERGRIEPFALGTKDVTGRLQIPQKLYGRKAEIGLLLGAFDRVAATGTPELLLVSGYSGIGKSALVHELYRPVVRDRGFFISGKCDRYKRDIPYSTIVQAFRGLVLEVLAESDERLAAFRQELIGAVGINGQLIVDVIPPVELVIGPQPKVAELPPTEAQNRFRMVLRRFIGVFAQKEHPLTLFLDDLQWADSASLGLLVELVANPGVHHLLVIGAYRDNEVSASHPLALALDEVRKAGARVSDIVLGAIPHEQLTAFVADALRCRCEEAAPLSELLEEKTGGNPFFAIQFLLSLHDERLIELDRNAAGFRWDMAKVRAKGFSDNVVDLMIGKLTRLPESTQEALKQLACLGNSVEVALLTTVYGRSEGETHADLWEAVRAGLVLRLDDTYKFLHDRVQEAAYSLIPEEQRAELHLRIGRRWLASASTEETEDELFDIVDQWNRGASLVIDAAEKAVLRRLNLRAGNRAKSAIAYASARSYLSHAAALLAPDAWTKRYEETFALSLAQVECEYLTGNFQRADELCTRMLDRARSDLDRSRVHRLRMQLYELSGRFDEAVTVAITGLRRFGVVFPSSDAELQAAFEAENQAIAEALRGRRIADLADAPVATSAEVRAILGLLSEALSPSYLVRPQAFPLFAVRAVSYALRCGNTEDACFAYSAYGAVLVSILGDIDAGYELSLMSLRLNEKLNDPKMRGRLLLVHGGNVHSWRRPFATSLPFLEQGVLASLEIGDLLFAFYNAYVAVWLCVEKGDPLDEVLAVSRKYAALSEQGHFEVGVHCIRLLEQFVASLQGAARAEERRERDARTESPSLAFLQQAGFGWGIAYHHIMQQIVAFHEERYLDARDAAVQAAAILREVRANPIEATHHFYHALTLAALYMQARPEQQAQLAQTLDMQLQKLAVWASSCPENFGDRAALVSAEIARIEGRDGDAMRLYELAIRSARESGFVHNEALAYEIASRFYRTRGFEKIADTYLREARACYARWGAYGKVSRIDQYDPRPFEPGIPTSTGTFAARPEQLDLLSVTKASQIISSEIVLDKLVHTLLEVVLEQGGAQRACLLLCQEGGLSMAAEATVEEARQAASLPRRAPAELSQRVPISLVQYVQRTKEHVILNDAAAEVGTLASDDYYARIQPRSVLCMPVLRQAEVVGVLYLENNLLCGAFTPDRLAALKLLAAQAAISLQNALLLAREQAARSAAEEAVRVRNEFLTVASHELNTPVTSLMLAVQSLRQAVPSGRPLDLRMLERLLGVAERQGVRLTKLVQDLLDVSRLEARRLQLDPSDFDLGALAGEVVERFGSDAARSQCRLSIADDAEVVGSWDRSRIDRVITNLIANAIKFGAGKPIEISVGSTRDVAWLSVQDHGIGIDPAEHGRIFERFERAVSERHYGGLGLGLYISRKIVEEHGGSIRCESQPGAGSTFTIELPLARPPHHGDEGP